MSTIDWSLTCPQYTIRRDEKRPLMLGSLSRLVDHHTLACPEYGRVIERLYPCASQYRSLDEIPFLPVGLFKRRALKSIPEDSVFRVLTSSGTTSDQTSAVFLDRETASLQTNALSSIVTSFIGNKRLPMLVVDTPSVIRDRSTFSARGAGVLGMLSFGRDHFYCLNDDMTLKTSELKEWLCQHRGQQALVFGFTFLVWEYLCGAGRGAGLEFPGAILIHGGGWKKLAEHAVTNQVFKATLASEFGVHRVHNFYGMAEQVGSVFMECEAGHLHAPDCAEVIVRDPGNWKPLSSGQLGVLQTCSVLARSYPGHSILTEDLGRILSTDRCSCGREGTQFLVEGRVPKTILRGCSDTYAFSREIVP